MAAAIPTTEPIEFVKGETVKWTKSLADYPSGTWTLSYVFSNASAAFANSTSVASGDAHLVTITAAASGALTAGTYKWQAKVTDGGEVYIVGEGTCEVKAGFVSGTAYDARSHVKKVLDALDAMIEGKADADQSSMSLNGRSLSRYSPDELIKWKSHYDALYVKELREERIAAGLGHGGKVRIRFVN